MGAKVWLIGAAIVGFSLEAAAAPPPGTAPPKAPPAKLNASGESKTNTKPPDPCPTSDTTSSTDPAEFEIGFDGSVHRNKVDEAHRNTVRILAGDFACERIARLNGHVTIGLSSRSSKFRDDPLRGDYRRAVTDLRVPIRLDDPMPPHAKDPDHWRVVIMIDRQAAHDVELGPPVAKPGATWKLIADRALKDEIAWIRLRLANELGAGIEPGPLSPTSRATAVSNVRELLPTATEFSETVHRIEYPVGEDAWLQLAHDLALDKLRAEADKLDATPKAPTDAFDSAWRRAIAQPDVLDSSLPTPIARPAPEAETAHCKDAWQYNVMKQPNSAEVDELGGWVFGVFELPLASRDDTVELGATGFALPPRAIATPGAVTAWARSVASDDDVRFEWVIGAGTQPDLGSVIGAFLTVIKGGINLRAVATMFSDVKTWAGWPETISDQLQALTSRHTCDGGEIRVAYPLTSLSSFRSVVSTSDLERDHNYTVYACKGPCTTARTDSVLAKGQLTTPSSGGFTLIGSLSYNIRPKWHTGFTQYQWQPTTASGNTQQVFELEQVTQPLQSYALAVALAYRFADCVAEHWYSQPACGAHAAFGAGPSIVYGDGSGHLTQWTANLFLAPWGMNKKKLYFTLGYGFRFFNQPLVAMEHDRVQGPPGMMTPALTQRTGVQQVLMFGLAFDLAGISDAASSVFGAKIAAPADPGAKGAP